LRHIALSLMSISSNHQSHQFRGRLNERMRWRKQTGRAFCARAAPLLSPPGSAYILELSPLVDSARRDADPPHEGARHSSRGDIRNEATRVASQAPAPPPDYMHHLNRTGIPSTRSMPPKFGSRTLNTVTVPPPPPTDSTRNSTSTWQNIIL
jgi:hypothetical protein